MVSLSYYSTRVAFLAQFSAELRTTFFSFMSILQNLPHGCVEFLFFMDKKTAKRTRTRPKRETGLALRNRTGALSSAETPLVGEGEIRGGGGGGGGGGGKYLG